MFTKGSSPFHLIFTSMLLLFALLAAFFCDSARSASLDESLNLQEARFMNQKFPSGGGGVQAGVISLSAADFIPTRPTLSFENHARYLIHLDGPYATGFYYAPVTLPQGAVVTGFAVFFRDNSTSDLTAKLFRGDDSGINTEMATVTSSGIYLSPSYGNKMDSTIEHATIDNSQYGYYASLEMPESTPGSTGPLVWFTGALIQFLYPSTIIDPGYYSLPTAAFSPYQDGYSYFNAGRYLEHYSGPGGDISHKGVYWGNVELPNGSSIASLTFYFRMDSSDYGEVRLSRSRVGYGNTETVAHIYIPSGTYNHNPLTTTNISSPIVDNSKYTYWIEWEIPPSDKPNCVLTPRFIVIQYTLPSSSSPMVPVSIPAAAFNAFEDGYDYQNDARYLQHFHDPWGGNNRGWYLAPVHIPQGARVTQVEFYWEDHSGTYTTIARLQRTDMLGHFYEMATLNSDGQLIYGWFGLSVTNSVISPKIDVENNAYWVVWDMPVWSQGAIKSCGMILYYTYPLYLPTVIKGP
jgi:hypothetical protein